MMKTLIALALVATLTLSSALSIPFSAGYKDRNSHTITRRHDKRALLTPEPVKAAKEHEHVDPPYPNTQEDRLSMHIPESENKFYIPEGDIKEPLYGLEGNIFETLGTPYLENKDIEHTGPAFVVANREGNLVAIRLGAKHVDPDAGVSAVKGSFTLGFRGDKRVETIEELGRIEDKMSWEENNRLYHESNGEDRAIFSPTNPNGIAMKSITRVFEESLYEATRRSRLSEEAKKMSPPAVALTVELNTLEGPSLDEKGNQAGKVPQTAEVTGRITKFVAGRALDTLGKVTKGYDPRKPVVLLDYVPNEDTDVVAEEKIGALDEGQNTGNVRPTDDGSKQESDNEKNGLNFQKRQSLASKVNVHSQQVPSTGNDRKASEKAQFQSYLTTYQAAQAEAGTILMPFIKQVLNGSNSSMVFNMAWSAYAELTGSPQLVVGPFLGGMNSMNDIEAQYLASTNQTNMTLPNIAAKDEFDDRDLGFVEWYAVNEALVQMYEYVYYNGSAAINQTGLLSTMATLRTYLMANDTSIMPKSFKTLDSAASVQTFFTQWQTGETYEYTS